MLPSHRARRGVLAAGTALALLATAGCGSSGSTDAAASSGPVTLEVWSRSAENAAETYEALLAAFTAETGIQVDYKPYTNLDQQLQTRAAGLDLPDVWINDSASLGTYQAQGWLQPVGPDDVAGSDAVPEALWDETVGLDGEHYAVPFSRQTMATFVRTDWLDALGLAVPTTWDELADVAQAFATEDPDGDGKDDTYGMAVPGASTNGYLGWWASSYIWQGGGDVLADGGDGTYTPAVTDDGTVAAVTWIKEQFCTAGSVAPSSLTAVSSDATTLFLDGTAGVYVTGPYNIAQFDDTLGADAYALIPTPAGPAGDTVLAEGENVYLGAGNDDTLEASEQLAAFLVSAEGQQLGMDDTSTQPVVRLPVNSTVDVEAVTGDARWGTVADALATSSRAFPAALEWTAVRQDLGEALNGIMADCGADNVASGLAALDTTLTAELADQGVLG